MMYRIVYKPADIPAGYTTLRRTTLRLLSHFVEKAFCRSVILANVHFVETGFRRNILCSPSRHIGSADHVTLSCDHEATDTGEGD